MFSLVVPARLMGRPASSTMQEVESTFTAFSLAAAPVAAMVWAIMLQPVKWRHRGSEPPVEPGPQIRGNTRLQVVWLVVSSVLCLFLLVWGLVVLQPQAGEAAATTAPTVVEVTGNQWAWTFAYPATPGSQSDVLYLPVDPPRAVPGHLEGRHPLVLDQRDGCQGRRQPRRDHDDLGDPDTVGTFTIRCAELCGLFHSYMQTRVHVVSADDYQRFVQSAVGPPCRATRTPSPCPSPPRRGRRNGPARRTARPSESTHGGAMSVTR